VRQSSILLLSVGALAALGLILLNGPSDPADDPASTAAESTVEAPDEVSETADLASEPPASEVTASEAMPPLPPIRLVGTLTNEKGEGLAVIEWDSGERGNYEVGAELLPDVFLGMIFPKHVMIINKGHFQTLYARSAKTGETPPAQVSPQPTRASVDRSSYHYEEEGLEVKGRQIKVSKDYLRHLTTDRLAEVIRDVYAEPVVEGGVLSGFRLKNIKRDSIFAKLGLAEGTVVTEINGMTLDSVPAAIKALHAVRSESSVEFTVIEGGAPKVLKVDVM
jgi:type II secretion system protein C